MASKKKKVEKSYDRGFAKGRFTKEECQYIVDTCNQLSAKEIATKLNRDPISIEKFLESKAKMVAKQQHDGEANKIKEDLRLEVFWLPILEQFSSKEVESFENYYCELTKSFNNDITYPEKIQLVSLIKLQLLIDRNLYERNMARKELEKIREAQEEFFEEKGHGPYMDPQDQLRSQSLDQQIRTCEAAYNSRSNEFKIMHEQHKQHMKDLKITRDQRIEVLKNSKKNWVDLMKSIMNEEVREREGRDATLMNMAANKELERLSGLHKYADGMIDQPILSADTVDLIETEEITEKENKDGK